VTGSIAENLRRKPDGRVVKGPVVHIDPIAARTTDAGSPAQGSGKDFEELLFHRRGAGLGGRHAT
jgi:hypothetical protein